MILFNILEFEDSYEDFESIIILKVRKSTQQLPSLLVLSVGKENLISLDYYSVNTIKFTPQRHQSGFHLSVEKQLVLRFVRHTIGEKNSRHVFIQPEVKPKPILTHSHAFSRALRQLHVITSSFLFLIGSLGCLCPP